MNVTHDHILNALKQVKDPDLNRDIVKLGTFLFFASAQKLETSPFFNEDARYPFLPIYA